MSSKKDLLDRMQQKPASSPKPAVITKKRPQEAGPEPSKETETRVAGGVIRRRSELPAPPPPPAPRGLPPRSNAPAASSAPSPQRTILRKADGDVGGGRSLPALGQPQPGPAPVSAVPTPPAPVSAPVAPAPEAPVAEPTPAPEAAPAVASAPAVEPSPAPQPVVEAAPAPAPEVVAPAPPPEVQSPTEHRAVVVRAAPDAPHRGPRPSDRGPTSDRAVVVRAADSAHRGEDPPRLPGLGKGVVRPPDGYTGRPEDTGPRLPGLGRAVVRPPPGYDPNDPNWNQRRMREAAPAPDAAARPARPGAVSDEDMREAARRAGVAMPGDDAGSRGKRGRQRRGRVEQLMEGIPTKVRRKRGKDLSPKTNSPKPKAQKRKIQIDNTASVGHLAKEMGVRGAEVIKKLMGLGVMATINDQIDLDTAQLVAGEFDYEVVNVGFTEQKVLIDSPKEDVNAVKRPPVVTVMGHVDHGKTTLLDTIRKAKVAAGEAGGITQHIGAYQVKRGKELVTFIDTPGHAAFTEMRARGALVTDVVILVVAADDGIMPQTVESINHTKAAGVPIVVAVNKVDKPGVKPENIRQKLMEHGLVPEEYGGDTMMVNVSALKGTGIDELLDAVLLVAELADLKADPDRHAEGVVLESKLETGRGSVATILVKKGTLKQGDPVVVGTTWGKVRALTDSVGKRVKSAGPSTPVEIIGLEAPPSPGDSVIVVTSEKDARTLAEHRADAIRSESAAQRQRVTLQDLFKTQQESEIKKLNLVLKADVQGSVEALRSAVSGIKVEGADLQILHSAVGAVSESDITLAATYGAIVLGFNVRPDANARRASEDKGVEVRSYRIIYELLDDVKKGLTGMLKPIMTEKVQGHAQVRQVFSIPKIGTIAGCMVSDGKIMRSHQARLLRDGVVVWEGKLASLRRFKDDVREVEKGYECGIGLEGFQDLKERDEIETYLIEAVAPV